MAERTARTSYQPSTFLERGASVPFTTPVLAGTRARPASRMGLELIVPNPSGGKGDYILPWNGLRALCRPTVHDIKLTERMATLRSVAPQSIRQAARQVASEGLAGRAASAAAEAADAAEASHQLYTNFHLLLCLVQQCEAPGAATIPPERDTPSNVEQRARATIAAIAPRMHRETQAIAANLEELSVLFSPIGLGKRATEARLPHAVAHLKVLRREVMRLSMDEQDEGVVALADMVTHAADATLRTVETVLQEQRDTAKQLLKLLISWQTDPATIGGHLARPDWLMDGWERICRIWSAAAGAAAQREALEEIVPLLPIIPKEAGEWVGFKIEFEKVPRTQRLVGRMEDWRTGQCVQDMIARNESLLAA